MQLMLALGFLRQAGPEKEKRREERKENIKWME